MPPHSLLIIDQHCTSPTTSADDLQFIAFNGIMVFIKYTEYYAAVPVSASVTEIMPVPYQLVRGREAYRSSVS
jgi:hypothetical protein